MKTVCKECGMAFPINPEFVNRRVDCPHCGAFRTLRSNEIIRNRPRQSSESSKKDNFDWLSFNLGMFLNIPGVVIAGCIRGGSGALTAILGMAISVIGYLLWLGYLRLAQGY